MSKMGIIIRDAWSLLAALVFCFVIVKASMVAAGNGTDTDREALLELRSRIKDDPLGILASWYDNSSVYFCQWHGVTCAPIYQRVVILDLRSLLLGGSISPYIGNLSFLERLHLQNNKFYGSIPTEIGNLVNLESLEMWNNQFSGTIPLSVGNLKMLYQLDLSDNFLEGAIPLSIRQCVNLAAINLSNNSLSGILSLQLLGLSSLSLLDVSGNFLSGHISNNLGSCVSLEKLDVHGNLFEGPVGLSLSSLRGLRAMDLSQNNLSGRIPEFLAGFELLQNLNLSYNNFEGVVPTQGIFKNASATSVLGNKNLCGGIPMFDLPTCSSKKTKRKVLTRPVEMVIAIDSGLLVLTMVLFSLFSYMVCKKKRANPIPSTSTDSTIAVPLNLSYPNLYKATNGFSSANLIGTGGVSSVYKGIFFEGRITVAVKVFNHLHPDASKSFETECTAMKNVSHRNIIKLLTVCSAVDYQGNEFNALVFELMPKGSLEEWLHEEDETNNVKRPKNLNSLQRLNIAIDVACALKYLHHDCQHIIAHCDLKPSNVLLDDEMTAHVGDFGIARFSQTLDKRTSSVGVNGTVGYIAPEYGTGARVSSYGDVYSFGIILLEMFTGLRPTDDKLKFNLNLHSFVKAALPERAEEVIDVVFFEEIEEEETMYVNPSSTSSSHNSIILECLIRICEIGFACSAELPRQRMKIDDVELGLRLIRKKLLQTPAYEKIQTINLSCQNLFNFTNDFSSENLIAAGKFCSVYDEIVFSCSAEQPSQMMKTEDVESRLRNAIPPAQVYGWKQFKTLSYLDLFSATNGFSSDNLIGAGIFCSVYQGVLFENQESITVKVFDHVASESFNAECKVMRYIRHRNIARVLTAVSVADNKGLDFKALVYEFMPNGCLEEWLHRKGNRHMGNLNFLNRVNIAIDVASALDYLHRDCQPSVALFDFKPSNIFLDDEMHGLVADFGKRRFLQANDQQTSSIMFKGSLGYIAPECGPGLKVSSYGDVYSFGIILLEMITGLKPTDDVFKNRLNLQNFVKLALPQRVEEIMDAFLLQEIKDAESSTRGIILECLIAVCEIGVACSAELPRERMKINDIEFRLRLIQMKLLQAPSHGMNSNKNLAYIDLFNATDGFSQENLISASDFCFVYRGNFLGRRSVNAVKVFDCSNMAASKSFKCECMAMENVVHQNIIWFVSAFSGVDFQGLNFKAIVYEFMPNGSLEEWLRWEINAHKGPWYLNFLQRLNIAIDVACALSYLHNDCQPPISHCDIKPSNVLLNDKMVGHVSGFGKSRFFRATDEQTSSTIFKGSIGYTAPECATGLEVSTYVDVYSFGILLLEMFTGSRPTDVFKQNLKLQDFVKSALFEQAEEIADTFLQLEIKKESTVFEQAEGTADTFLQLEIKKEAKMNLNASSCSGSIILECFFAICAIGVACSAELPGERMKINDAETRLRLTKTRLLESPIYEDIQTSPPPSE